MVRQGRDRADGTPQAGSRKSMVSPKPPHLRHLSVYRDGGHESCFYIKSSWGSCRTWKIICFTQWSLAPKTRRVLGEDRGSEWLTPSSLSWGLRMCAALNLLWWNLLLFFPLHSVRSSHLPKVTGALGAQPGKQADWSPCATLLPTSLEGVIRPLSLDAPFKVK